jgi:hypothetical protein
MKINVYNTTSIRLQFDEGREWRIEVDCLDSGFCEVNHHARPVITDEELDQVQAIAQKVKSLIDPNVAKEVKRILEEMNQ